MDGVTKKLVRKATASNPDLPVKFVITAVRMRQEGEVREKLEPYKRRTNAKA